MSQVQDKVGYLAEVTNYVKLDSHVHAAAVCYSPETKVKYEVHLAPWIAVNSSYII